MHRDSLFIINVCENLIKFNKNSRLNVWPLFHYRGNIKILTHYRAVIVIDMKLFTVAEEYGGNCYQAWIKHGFSGSKNLGLLKISQIRGLPLVCHPKML